MQFPSDVPRTCFHRGTRLREPGRPRPALITHAHICQRAFSSVCQLLSRAFSSFVVDLTLNATSAPPCAREQGVVYSARTDWLVVRDQITVIITQYRACLILDLDCNLFSLRLHVATVLVRHPLCFCLVFCSCSPGPFFVPEKRERLLKAVCSAVMSDVFCRTARGAERRCKLSRQKVVGCWCRGSCNREANPSSLATLSRPLMHWRALG